MPQGKFYRELGRRVTAARKAKKYTQQRLASLVGLSRTSVTNIEKGRQPVDVHVLASIANVCGVSIPKLIPESSFLGASDVKGLEKYGAEERRFFEMFSDKQDEFNKEE